MNMKRQTLATFEGGNAVIHERETSLLVCQKSSSRLFSWRTDLKVCVVCAKLIKAEVNKIWMHTNLVEF